MGMSIACEKNVKHVRNDSGSLVNSASQAETRAKAACSALFGVPGFEVTRRPLITIEILP
jgi:hypothetical protein